MLINLLNEYYDSIFGWQIYDFSTIEKIKVFFFSKNTLLFFSFVPNNDLITPRSLSAKTANRLKINKKPVSFG
jgi:hypothetical protein